MALLCRILGHAAGSVHHHNQGLEFSICMRCGDDLLRREGAWDWSPLPKGTKVVWRRDGRGIDSDQVAARMAGPPPRRHATRALPQGWPNPSRRREHPLRGKVEMLQTLGTMMFYDMTDRSRTPAPQWKLPAIPVIYLPAGKSLGAKAISRSRGRSHRAWWSEHSAPPPRPIGRRGTS